MELSHFCNTNYANIFMQLFAIPLGQGPFYTNTPATLTYFLPHPIIYTHWSIHEAVISLGHAADILGNQRSSTQAEANTSQIQYQFGKNEGLVVYLLFQYVTANWFNKNTNGESQQNVKKCQSDGLPLVYWTNRPPFYVNDGSKYTRHNTLASEAFW